MHTITRTKFRRITQRSAEHATKERITKCPNKFQKIGDEILFCKSQAISTFKNMAVTAGISEHMHLILFQVNGLLFRS
jgi:hypothetical protein